MLCPTQILPFNSSNIWSAIFLKRGDSICFISLVNMNELMNNYGVLIEFNITFDHL